MIHVLIVYGRDKIVYQEINVNQSQRQRNVRRAVVEAQLAERSNLTPEICSWNPNISNEIF